MKSNIPKNIISRKWLVLIILYSFSHILLLSLFDSVYWDDWQFIGTDSKVILEVYKETGSMLNLNGYIHIFFLRLGLWSYKYVTFILMFISGVLLYFIAKRNAFLNEGERFLSVLLFLTAPFYAARVANIDIFYTLCYFLFFLAWQISDKYRIPALILFFISFNTNSLLVFYAIPFIDRIIINNALISRQNLIDFFYRNLDFLLLPFFYWFIKKSFFKPYGMYAGYNENFNVNHLQLAILQQYQQLERLVAINMAHFSFSLLTQYLVILLIIYLLITFSKFRLATITYKRFLILTTSGLIILIFGLLPYWIVFSVPLFNSWNSRHQLLMPLGFAVFTTAIIGLLPFKKFVTSLIVAAFIMMNIYTYKSLFVDWQKQTQLIEILKNSSEIKNSQLILFIDNSKYLNAFNRNISFYEWNGMLALAYGNEDHFGIELNDFYNFLNARDNTKYFTPAYKAGNFNSVDGVTQINVEISEDLKFKIDHKYVSYLFPKLTIKTEKSLDKRFLK